ncbi:MAG: dephospho-CoA kinase [Bacteroidales bacterium]|jgi:dephospho-CoA kinase|nr:dephospho-CoA kinase [Bacteroidales bacterium]
MKEWKVALSGGIGSGKTHIAQVFSALAVPVYNSDLRAKELMQSDEKIRRGLIALLGEETYKGAELNKQFVAQQIFSNNEMRRQVNAIVHPVVIRHYEAWSAAQNVPYTIMETALLFENDVYTHFDTTIYITAPMEERIVRVMKRDMCSREEVEKRMKMQQNDTICVQKADFVIENNNFALSQVLTIHEQIVHGKIR